MASKRIRDLTERTTLSSGDYLATDNSSGTRKVNASKILDPIDEAQDTADLVTDRVSNSGDAFSSSSGYSVGDLVIAPDDNLIYRCKTAYSTGASWATRKTNFEQVSCVGELNTLNAALLGLLKSESKAGSKSVTYGTPANIDISITIPTGYEILTFAFNSNTVSTEIVSSTYNTSTNTFSFYVKNIAGSTITCGVNLMVVYIKSGYVS